MRVPSAARPYARLVARAATGDAFRRAIRRGDENVAGAQVAWRPRAIRIFPERTSSACRKGRSSSMNASSFSLEPWTCRISESEP